MGKKSRLAALQNRFNGLISTEHTHTHTHKKSSENPDRHSTLSPKTFFGQTHLWFWCGFDRASSIICGNKMPTRCNRWIFIADLIACSTFFGHHYAHHQELESIIQVVAAYRIWFSSCRYGVELRVVCPVCGLKPRTKYDRQQPLVKYSRAPDDGNNGARNMLSKQYDLQ
jgi:hypothetical protein